MSSPPTGNTRSLSYWIDTVPPMTPRPTLAEDLTCEVCIVGAGMAGITAAYILAGAGRDVVVLDRGQMAMEDTGHTTAHLQRVDDARLSHLVPRFGLDNARLVWDGHDEALRFIESNVEEHQIRCDFTRLDAYLYSPHAKDKRLLKEERRLARKIGYPAEWADADEVPFPAEHAIKFPSQGKFHPRKYLVSLRAQADRRGARFYENTEVVEVKKGRHVKVTTREGSTVKAKWFLSCSNVPFAGSDTIHTKVQPYRTYVVAARVPKNVFGEALYWDTEDPYHYTRVEHKADHDLVILGGEDHLVGAVDDTERRWGLLYEHLKLAVPEFEPAYQWSGQVIETVDDLPYIGRIPGRGKNELMVTGDSGTGMTFGTLGGIMLAERVLGRGTPWDELFDPQRVTADATPMKEWLKHNLHAGGVLAKRMLQPSEIRDVAELRYGEGALMKFGMKPVAVARGKDGTLCAVSGACTHMGCGVKWNSGEQSWDCPCHGSRFAPTGEVLHGPAKEPLAEVDIEDVLEKREERQI